MPDYKTSDLTTLLGVDVDGAADLIEISDISAGTSKKITPDELGEALGVGGSNTVMALIATADISTAVTTHTFSGLDGNADFSYILKGVIVNTLAAAPSVEMRFNSDSSTNYGRSAMQVNGTAFSGASTTGLTAFPLGNTRGSGIPHFIDVDIPVSKTGADRGIFVRNFSNTSFAEACNYNNVSGMIWNNHSTNITSIDLFSDTANGIGVGSFLQLWAVR